MEINKSLIKAITTTLLLSSLTACDDSTSIEQLEDTNLITNENTDGSNSGNSTGSTSTDSPGTDSTGTDSSGTDSTGTDSTGTDSTGTDSTGIDISFGNSGHTIHGVTFGNIQFSSVSDELNAVIHPIVSVIASAEQDGNPATNAIDGDSSGDSRWSADSDAGEANLDLDLGAIKTVNTLQIEFLKPLERNTCFNILTSEDGQNWTSQRENITSYGAIFYSFIETDARYVRYDGLGNSSNGWNSIAEIAVLDKELSGDEDISDGGTITCDTDVTSNEVIYTAESSALALSKTPLIGGAGATFNSGRALDLTQDPGNNFDLSLWKITYPDASEIQPPAVIDNEFYTDDVTGAMVFQCPNYGSTTSSSTKYSRSELREMINSSAGTKELGNNWVVSTASAEDQAAAGGVDGNMKATISVEQVSTTTDVSSEYMIGRVIVGQIHASDDEPFKLYYRLLPGHTKGFVYFAYEDSGSETFYPMLGDTGFTVYGSNVDATEPADGIELGEKWSYEVDVVGRDMTVTITKSDGSWVARTITWSSEYDSDWFYFKAGSYNQNNGGEASQFVRTSFYDLEVSHN